MADDDIPLLVAAPVPGFAPERPEERRAQRDVSLAEALMSEREKVARLTLYQLLDKLADTLEGHEDRIAGEWGDGTREPEIEALCEEARTRATSLEYSED